MAASFLLALIAGAADLVGGLLTVARRQVSRESLLYTTGLAAGFIVAVALLDRVPEAMTPENPRGALFILIGFFGIYLLENSFSTHAHNHATPLPPSSAPAASSPHGDRHGACGHDHAADHNHGHTLVAEMTSEHCDISIPASNAALLGLLLHTLFDGVAIAAGFAADRHTGLLMFMAVIFHKLPEGFSASALMLAAGRGRRFAVVASGLLGLSTCLGALLASTFLGNQALEHQHGLAQGLLSLSTGTFLYIGCSDMIPATNQGANKRVVLMVFLGVFIYLATSALIDMAGVPHHEHHHAILPPLQVGNQLISAAKS